MFANYTMKEIKSFLKTSHTKLYCRMVNNCCNMTDNEEREFFESMVYELDYSLIPPDQFTQSIALPEQNQIF